MKKLFLKNDYCDHCDNCDYTSFYSGHLNKHKKGKHDEVKFNCDQRDYTSSYFGRLNLHKKIKHKKLFPVTIVDINISKIVTLNNIKHETYKKSSSK